jgi:hypothetical protein
MCFNELQVVGRRQDLAEFAMLLNQQLLHEFVNPVIDGAGWTVFVPMRLPDKPMRRPSGAIDRREKPLPRPPFASPNRLDRGSRQC